MRHLRDIGGFLVPEKLARVFERRTKEEGTTGNKKKERKVKKLLIGTLALALAVSFAPAAFAASATSTTTVTVAIAAAAAISVPATTTLTYVGSFPTGSYNGSTTETFSCRTSRVGGSGQITLSATAATWTAAASGTGPAVADLQYTSAAGTYGGPGTYTTTSTVVQNGVETNVLTGLGTNNRTDTKTIVTSFTLADKVSWETDTYTLPVRWTLTAL